MAANKFFLTLEPASHQRGYAHFHFATNLNRTLSLEEGKELRDLLTGFLGDAPKPAKAGPSPDQAKLRAFLLENFKGKTGNETPEACAIRLLSETLKK